jgi:hypothetical protein
VASVDSMSPHLSNVDVLPLKRKELREYILVSVVSTSRLYRSLACILFLLVVCLLVTSREFHLVAHLENLPFVSSHKIGKDLKLN